MSDKVSYTQEDLESFLSYCVVEVDSKRKLIKDLAKEFERKFGEEVSTNAMQHRISRYRLRVKKGGAGDMSNVVGRQPGTELKEYTTTFGDHSVEAQRIIEYQDIVYGDEEKLLEYLGFNPKHWEFVYVQRSIWNQQTKDVDPKTGQKIANLYSVKFKVKPKNELDPEEYASAIQKAIEDGITPMPVTYTPKEKNGLDNNKLMEIAPVELHLGKLAHSAETGQDYDLHIATNKFYAIFERIVEQQRVEKCGKCLIVIGSDFFNSESDNMTTAKTPQQNDTRYKKLMVEGFKMYVSVILRLREVFNGIDVILCSGNHARAMEFFMYHSLQQYFRDDDIINFSNDYKDTQAYVFGKSAIFYNHGDSNLNRTIRSIPSEFYEIWGKTLYRELHLGHLHKEVTVDDDCGMITRRIGSPSATDAWHYQNRFIGAVQKHQTFVWSAEDGLQTIHYINTATVK